MKTLLLALSLCLIVSCNTSNKSTSSLSDHIPDAASIVFKINDIEAFKSDIKNSDLLSRLSISDRYKAIKNQLETLNELKTSHPVLLCIIKNKDSLDYTLITRVTDSLFGKTPIDSLRLYSKIQDSILVASNFKKNVGNTSSTSTASFNRMEFPIDENNTLSAVFNNNNASILEDFFNLSFPSESKTNLTLETELTPDYLQFNGVAMAIDSTISLPNIFKNTLPLENSIQQIAPESAEGFISLTFNDFGRFYQNILAYQVTEQDSINNLALFETLNEIGEVYTVQDTVLVLKSIDAFTTKDALIEHQDVIETYRDVDILSFDEPDLFRSVLGGLISNDSLTHYTVVDDFFVFGKSTNALKPIIGNYRNQTTLSNSDSFKASMEYLSDESSVLFVCNSNKLKSALSRVLNTELNNVDVKSYDISAFQLVQDDGFAHFNGIISKTQSKSQSNTVSEEFSVTLDAEVLMAPHFIDNHRTGQKDIVVQDINNVLYLISNSGKVLWKKQLRGPILVRMQQVDLYKNGRLQMAFATPNRVYILDRNGQDVAPFPLKFNDDITQPLSVFDYDNRRNYRFLVTQNNTLLMYDKAGKAVSGFNYNGKERINNQPKHFRLGSKDYIVFTAENKIKILNRKGQIRINVREAFPFSENPVFVYNNQFTTTTTGGHLVQIQTNGKVNQEPLNLLKDHFIDATSRTLVTLTENQLQIKQKQVELDFGNYTQPKIFYLNDKIYVTLTDLQTQKVYLFDSQARPISHFPVYGNSTIDLDNMDKDNKLEFVCIGEQNAIVVYKKNNP